MEPQTDIVASTSVDILVERIKTHPEEFFNKDSVVSRDGEKIFAHTKWRRITTLLMANPPEGVTDNLWLNLFKPDEVQRFRAAMYAALRAEIDTTIVKVLVGESPDKLNPDAEEAKAAMEAMTAARQLYMAARRNNSLGSQLPGGIYRGDGGAATFSFGTIQPGASQANAPQAASPQPQEKPKSLRERLFDETKLWLK